MKLPPLKSRTAALLAVLVPLLGVFIYVLLRSGPLAPIPVTVANVEKRSIAPALFGIGTVAARYTYKIGPTVAGRVQRVDVDVGDKVRAGQMLGEIEPVDLDQRILAQAAAVRRADSSLLAAQAQLRDASARWSFADKQAQRYEKLLQARSVSEEAVAMKRQELRVAEAVLASARAELEVARQERVRNEADSAGLIEQRSNLRLVTPVDGLVVARNADPGTTVVAGQSVVEIIDPAALWIDVRFDQLSAGGLRAGLPAQIQLRSRSGQQQRAHVLRVEPLADAVTEETLAKVVFDTLPEILPPLGELAEVTVALPALPAAPVVPNAAIRRVDGQLGVWLLDDGDLRFAPIKIGATDLDGGVQVREGLTAGDQVVVHSRRPLSARSRIKVVEGRPGVAL